MHFLLRCISSLSSMVLGILPDTKNLTYITMFIKFPQLTYVLLSATSCTPDSQNPKKEVI
jgi:hypothetical protein